MLRLELACKTDCARCIHQSVFEAVSVEVEVERADTASTRLVKGIAQRVGRRLAMGLTTE